MPNIAKYHHIVPVLQLRRFTPSGTEDDLLWALNLSQKKSRQSTPRSTGGQNHYNSLDISGVRRDALERDLNDLFETPAAKVIDGMISSNELPEGDDFITLMKFVVLMHSRVEGVREAKLQADELITKQTLRLYAVNASWRVPEEIEKYREKGVEIPEHINAETLLTLEFNEYRIKFPQNWIVGNFITSLQVLDEIVPWLVVRQCTLHVVRDSSSEFICSDGPVVLTWTGPIPYSRNMNPGLAHTHAELTIPITRRMCLVSKHRGCKGLLPPDGQKVVPASEVTVAKINRRTLDWAYREVYSASKDFLWIMNDGTINRVADPVLIQKQRNEDIFWGCAK